MRSSENTMISVGLEGISKTYRRGSAPILEAIDIQIGAGELFFLLGPSGCGKSTLLRIVAGLLEPSSGRIFFGGQDVTALPTEDRQTAMVFQNYALWPHMSVLDNVLFGLSIRKVPGGEAGKQARAALDMVGMGEYAARRPVELSGGQQQRVALARAIVVKPKVLLLDEPLSNLDAKLRVAMRREIRGLCKSAGLTAIYVTHDQKEALAMADRMAVLHEGRLQQVGAPREIYRRPANRFVAGFIGECSFVEAKVVGREDGKFITESPLGRISGTAGPDANFAEGAKAALLIRPESLRIVPDGAAGQTGTPSNSFQAVVSGSVFLGESGQWIVDACGIQLVVFEQDPPERKVGDKIRLQILPDNVVIL